MSRTQRPEARQQPPAPPLSWRSRRILVPAMSGITFLVLLTLFLMVVRPLFAMTTITLMPQTHHEAKTFLVDANQIHAHQITATAPAQNKTVNVSGTIPARQATGKLIFLNQTNVDVIIQSTTITGKSGVAVTFTGTITVPAVKVEADATGYAVTAGPGGNIPLFDIDKYCCAPNQEVLVKNDPFTGGRDAIPNNKVQQSDIDTAAQNLIPSQTQQEQNNLKSQLMNNEQVVNGSNQCKPAIAPDHPAGTQAATVTVSVSVTCTEEVYDAATAQTAATNLLTTQATQDLGATYQLASMVAVSVTEENNGQFSLKAQGIWAYTFSATRLSQLAEMIANKSPAAARALLLSQPGITDVQISTTGTLPSAKSIQIKVQAP